VVGRCHVGLGHVHTLWIPPKCRGSVPRMSLYTLSAILSFVSLDICISPVEYDENFAKGNHNEKE
jgi:hypothetical protein